MRTPAYDLIDGFFRQTIIDPGEAPASTIIYPSSITILPAQLGMMQIAQNDGYVFHYGAHEGLTLLYLTRDPEPYLRGCSTNFCDAGQRYVSFRAVVGWLKVLWWELAESEEKVTKSISRGIITAVIAVKVVSIANGSMKKSIGGGSGLRLHRKQRRRRKSSPSHAPLNFDLHGPDKFDLCFNNDELLLWG